MKQHFKATSLQWVRESFTTGCELVVRDRPFGAGFVLFGDSLGYRKNLL